MTVARVSSWDQMILDAEARGRRAGIDEAAKAANSVRYGAPSGWPTKYPLGWMHPPCWDAARVPTPAEAAMHDNGVFDATVSIRALLQQSGDASAARSFVEKSVKEAGHGE